MVNELYHNGVKGQRWGHRNGPPYPLNAEGKEALKDQKKKLDDKSREDYKMHKAYNRQRAHRAVRRDVATAMIAGGALGVALGGPAAGLGSMLTSGLATTAFSTAVNSGRNIVNNRKYKQMLLSDNNFKSAAKKGSKLVDSAREKELQKFLKEYENSEVAKIDEAAAKERAKDPVNEYYLQKEFSRINKK